MKNNKNTKNGTGFCGLLTIAFIVLKLCGVIAWSWVWVLSPLWIPCAVAVIIAIIAVIILKVTDNDISDFTNKF